MSQVAIWQISEGKPARIAPGGVELEKRLEDWIETDPSLVEAGLRIIGRQIPTEGGTLDLLGIDPQGQLVVIELKRGAIYRETITQAIDYAASIAETTWSEVADVASRYLADRGSTDTVEDVLGDHSSGEIDRQDVRVVVAGVGRDESLERFVNFLAPGVAVAIVSFQSYELPDGQQVLVRELTEAELSFDEERARRVPTPEALCEQADARGIGPQFQSLMEAARRHGLYLRPFRKSLMVAPQAKRSKALFTIWPEPVANGEMAVWLGPEVFAQFYPPLTEAEVTAELGEGGWLEMTKKQVDGFVASLGRLFAKLRGTSLAELGRIADGGGPGAGWAVEELDRLAEAAGIDTDKYKTWVAVAKVLEKRAKDGAV